MLTQTFPTQVLLTISTGSELPEVSLDSVLRAVSHLLGEPVAPHQLATPEPWTRAREELLRQHPSFHGATSTSLRNAPNIEAWIAREIEILGEARTIQRGVGRDVKSVSREAISSLIAIATKAPFNGGTQS